MTRALVARRSTFVAGLGFACLLFLGLLMPQICQADAVYNVSGTFGTAFYTGPLNDGTFSGTFDATLPASGFASITTFKIELISASGVVLVDMTNATVGYTGYVSVLPASSCSGGIACDSFGFGNGSTFLILATPAGFTGGAIYPFDSAFPPVNSFAGFGGNTGSTDSVVTSGSITPTPEPSTLVLTGIALLFSGLLFGRRIPSHDPLTAARLHE